MVSRAELALLLLIVLVVAFLFWTRNVIVRVPGVPTPISRTVGSGQWAVGSGQ